MVRVRTRVDGVLYQDVLIPKAMQAAVITRMKILADMEKVLCVDQAPIVPIYFWVGMALYHPDKVGGFAPNFVDDHRWGELYIPGKTK